MPGIDTSSSTTSGAASLCIACSRSAAARERLHVVAARAQQRIQVLDELLIVVDDRKLGGGH